MYTFKILATQLDFPLFVFNDQNRILYSVTKNMVTKFKRLFQSTCVQEDPIKNLLENNQDLYVSLSHIPRNFRECPASPSELLPCRLLPDGWPPLKIAK